MSIATIIVNYNAGETLKRCVQALLQSSINTSLTLVDNASSDKSAEKLQSLYGNHQGIAFHFNGHNLGFAPAVNAVARQLKTDWVLILNPDCILEPDCLEQLVTAMESDGKAGIAGPSVRDEKGKTQRATVRRFPSPWKSLMTASGLWRLGKWLPSFHGVEVDITKKPEKTQVTEAVSGACMLVRRSALQEVGYLDEDYAMHCEDLDLMFRFKQLGLHCLYVPAAVCTHQQGLSSSSRPHWVHVQKHRGMVRFFKKFQAGDTSFPVRMLVYTGIWLRMIILWPLVLIKK